MDTTDATADASKILSTYTAYIGDGSKATGTATGGHVTQDQDGYIVLPKTGDGGGSSDFSTATLTTVDASDIELPIFGAFIRTTYNDDYASFQLSGGSTGTVYLDMSDIAIPSGATIKSVVCQATLQYNRNNSSSGFTASCRMYTGSTAKGSATTVVSAGGTDVAKTTFNLSVGSWTASELASARFYLTATNNASSTRRYIYVYGVSLNVTYESDGVVYIYTLSNVTADHTIVVSASTASDTLYVKLSGTWKEVTAAYKKVSGSWVLQSDVTTVFQSGTNYKQG